MTPTHNGLFEIWYDLQFVGLAEISIAWESVAATNFNLVVFSVSGARFWHREYLSGGLVDERVRPEGGSFGSSRDPQNKGALLISEGRTPERGVSQRWGVAPKWGDSSQF